MICPDWRLERSGWAEAGWVAEVLTGEQTGRESGLTGGEAVGQFSAA